MTRTIKCTLLSSLLLALPLAGCNRDGWKEIHGTVRYAGDLVQSGKLTFLPPGGNGPTAEALIKDGEYRVRLAPGKKVVQIVGYKVVGQHHWVRNNPNTPLVDELETYLTKELTRDIAGGGVYDFNLEK